MGVSTCSFLKEMEEISFNIGNIEDFKDYSELVQKTKIVAQEKHFLNPEIFLKIEYKNDLIKYSYLPIPFKAAPSREKIDPINILSKTDFETFIKELHYYKKINIFLF
ncbi:MAG: hypothetical protein A3F40_00500 [Chlamydiae bacterium RIFCSPHIGHO2_12_FULL_27_8]|nr:MAG: hypothetical protein A3F40_00500 [Chlamydiae bacterium RIFCSPHIGHO2_12_FULL_27_8]